MKKLTLILLMTLMLGVTTVYAETQTVQLHSVIPSANARFADIILSDKGPVPAVGSACTPGLIGFFNPEHLYFCDAAGAWIGSFNAWLYNPEGNITYPLETHVDHTVVVGSQSLAHLSNSFEVDGISLVYGDFGTDRSLGIAGAGTRMFFHPRKAAFRAGGVSSTDWDDANIGDYSIASGQDTVASGAHSGALSGFNNTAAGEYSVVAGGRGNTTINTASDDHSAILGGLNNTINQMNAVIVGGDGNTIGNNTGGWNSVIVGGRNNVIEPQGMLGFIGGGELNRAGPGDGVVAGYQNTTWSPLIGAGNHIGGGAFHNIAPGVYGSAVVGGSNNDINTLYSFIGGGENNTAAVDGWHAVIVGGSGNTASGVGLDGHATIVGGTGNTASGDYTFIGSGANNTASGDYAVVVGGGDQVTDTNRNTATANYAVVGGGQNNDATATYTTISGGQNNVASATHGTIAGGLSNTASGGYSLAAGGANNIAAGDYSVALGKGASADVLADYSFVFCNEDTAADCNVTHADGAYFVSTAKFGVGTNYVNDAVATEFANGDMHVGGTITASGDILPFSAPSDERLKEDVAAIENSLEKIKKINGVSYVWKQEKENGRTESRKEIGVTAQDVKSVFPEAIHEGQAGYMVVKYGNLIAPLIEAVKELDNKVTELKEENQSLRRQLLDLQSSTK